MGGGVCVGPGGGGGGSRGRTNGQGQDTHYNNTTYGSNLLGRERHYDRESCKKIKYISETNDGKHIKMQNAYT